MPAGGIVNYTTKGGTNSLHGNAAWYYNVNALNANDWFNDASDPITPRPHAVSNQWAASVGGPIKKDKLFFFFDAEGLRYVLPGGGGAEKSNLTPAGVRLSAILSFPSKNMTC